MFQGLLRSLPGCPYSLPDPAVTCSTVTRHLKFCAGNHRDCASALTVMKAGTVPQLDRELYQFMETRELRMFAHLLAFANVSTLCSLLRGKIKGFHLWWLYARRSFCIGNLGMSFSTHTVLVYTLSQRAKLWSIAINIAVSHPTSGSQAKDIFSPLLLYTFR